jgi:DNA-directed RNA polymerase specialized sigma24 family protein
LLDDTIAYYDQMVKTIARQFAQVDPHWPFQVVADALMEYGARPAQFDEGRGVSLVAFLLMACRRNMLNLLRGEARRRRYEGQYAQMCAAVVVELDPLLGNLLQDESRAQLARREQSCMDVLEATQDQKILALQLQGERRTTAFAAILGISHLPMKDQRLEVKRAKDRIDKKLRRERLGADHITGGSRASKDVG